MRNELQTATEALERRKYYLTECMKDPDNPWAEANQIEIDALDTAIAALREPAHEWVRTTDRLPTEEDAIEVHDEWGCTHKEVACLATGWPFEGLVKDRPAMLLGMMDIETIKQRAKQFPYWMPLPEPPKEDGHD